MSEKESDAVLRYKSMIEEEGRVHGYFDTDEIDEVTTYYESDERFDLALDAVEYGLSLHPGNPELVLKKIKYLLWEEKLDEAEALLNKQNPDSEIVLLFRVELLLLRRDFDAAQSVIDTLFRSDDLTLDTCFDIVGLLIDLASLDDVTRFVHRAMKVYPEGEIELYRELASAYEMHDEDKKAIDIYNLLLDQDPYSATDWFSLAKVYALDRNYEAAIEACDFALTVSDGDEDMIVFMGRCYYDVEMYEKAIEVFKELLEFDTKKAIAYELISQCYMKLEKPAESVCYLEKAVEIDADRAALYYQLATGYYDLGNREKVYEMLRKTLELNAIYPDAQAFLGELYLQDGHPEEALKYFLGALKWLFSEEITEELLALTGDAYYRLGDIENTIRYYELSLEKNPYNVKLIFKLIMVYFNIQDQTHVSEWMYRLESYAAEVDRLTDISDENREEIRQVKQVLNTLKAILRDTLNEDISE